MPESYFNYRGNKSTTANTNIARSESIWWDCPWERIRNGEVEGFAHYWDFSNFKPSSNVNAAEAYWDQGLSAFGDNGAAVTALDANGGGVSIGSDGDNEGASFHELGAPAQIDRTTGDFWFEAMVKVSALTDAKNNVFLGVADTTAFTATVPITAAGAIADLNLVGFFRPETARTVAGTGGAIMNAVYRANGVAAVNVLTDAVTLVADTYIKLGLRLRGQRDENIQGADANTKYIFSYYANGVRLSSYKQIPTAQGTDFPNDVRLGFAFAILNATGTTPGTASIRWARHAQLL